MNNQLISFKFEKLLVWQKALDYVDLIYRITRDFPKSELFGLQSQLRRAAVSIALNIAEGSGRTTKKDFRKFVHDAVGSLRETVTGMHIVKRLEYVKEHEFIEAYQKSIELSKLLYGLERSLRD